MITQHFMKHTWTLKADAGSIAPKVFIETYQDKDRFDVTLGSSANTSTEYTAEELDKLGDLFKEAAASKCTSKPDII